MKTVEKGLGFLYYLRQKRSPAVAGLERESPKGEASFFLSSIAIFFGGYRDSLLT
jgi:hypothetical protein